MVWYNLKVGRWSLKYMPLNPIENEYTDCDKDGNPLKKVPGKYEKGFFIDEKGNKFDTAFKLIKGKPMAKLSKTKEVTLYKEVNKTEVTDLLVERQYIVECDELLEDLRNSEKALKFGFSNGNGFKVFKAYIHTSDIYKGYLFMSMGRTQISELIGQIEELQQQKKKMQQIDITLQGIDRAKVEELIEL